eukprot:g17479.t1
MTPRQRKYVNDFQSEYISEFRPNIFVPPTTQKYAHIPAGYKTHKTEAHTHWETPRVPPYHRVVQQVGAGTEQMLAPMISARSRSASSTTTTSSGPHYDRPHNDNLHHKSRSMPRKLRRKLQDYEHRRILEDVERPDVGPVPYGRGFYSTEPHPKPRRRAQSAFHTRSRAKRPNWRTLGSEGREEPMQQGWMVP